MCIFDEICKMSVVVWKNYILKLGMTSFMDLVVVFWITIKQTDSDMNPVLDSDNSLEGAFEICKSFISVWTRLIVEPGQNIYDSILSLPYNVSSHLVASIFGLPYTAL